MNDIEDMTPFEQLLDKTLKQYNPFRYLQSNGKLKILDIGCGSASEVPLLREYSGNSAQVTGIDINETSIKCAKSEYPTDTFICGDAREIIGDLPNDFDMILMLHPEIYHNYAFQEILRMSSKKLIIGGILFAALYSEIEHQIMDTLSNGMNFKLHVSGRNRMQPKQEYMERFQYLVIGQKKS